jgi:hypothetical protein
MTLPASGPISFNNINVELGVSGTTQASLGQTSYRTLAGVASGQISMSNFYGKANQFAFTISTNQTNANLASLATAAGWNGTSKVVATIGSGIYVYSTSTGTPALTISGSFPGGVELINSGLIYGMGGAGGVGGGFNGSSYTNPSAGSVGGNALTVSVAVSITNNGTISGGGGGGGGGGYNAPSDGKFIFPAGGGGGGGGRVNASGGSGGVSPQGSTGSAGGSGTLSAAGVGGPGGARSQAPSYPGGTGGTGGVNAATGSAGARPALSPNAGSFTGAGAAGGAGGSAVSGNANITWVATGTRYGAIS